VDCGEGETGGQGDKETRRHGSDGAVVGVVVERMMFRLQVRLRRGCWPGPDQVEISAS